MGTDKAKDKLQQAAGKVKEGIGNATGDEDLSSDGQKDQVAGNVKEVGHDVRDKVAGRDRPAERGAGDVGEKVVDATEKAKRKLT